MRQRESEPHALSHQPFYLIGHLKIALPSCVITLIVSQETLEPQHKCDSMKEVIWKLCSTVLSNILYI